MRTRSVPVVLSTVTLVGWMGGAAAQEATPPLPPPMTAPGVLANPVQQTGTDDDSNAGMPGAIPQPSLNSPGVVLGVSVGELFTDNLKLAGSGQSKESAWITSIKPFIKAAYSAPRFQGILDYSLTGFLYAGKASDNQLGQNLHAMGTLVALPQHLFIDGTATYQQEVINNELPVGSGTFFLNGNQANVGTASLSPYWVQDLGRVGTAVLRYTRGRVIYNRDGISGVDRNDLRGIPNTNSDAWQFSLTSPTDTDSKWGWNALYTQQKLKADSGGSIEFAQARIGASYQILPSTQLLVDGGKENNFLPDGRVEHLGAKFWDAGFQWANTRDQFKFLWGHRFYGRSAQLSWTHQAARLTTVVGYLDQPTNLNQQLLGQNPGAMVLEPGSNIFSPSLRDSQVYVMKRASASASYELPRGNLNLTLYDELRRYIQLDNETERVANATLGWTYELGPQMTFTPSIGWQRYEFRDDHVNYTRYVQLSLIRQITASDSVSLRYRNDSRSSFIPVETTGRFGNYRVNVVYLEWTHLF